MVLRALGALGALGAVFSCPFSFPLRDTLLGGMGACGSLRYSWLLSGGDGGQLSAGEYVEARGKT